MMMKIMIRLNNSMEIKSPLHPFTPSPPHPFIPTGEV
jgi:hypothetical protein